MTKQEIELVEVLITISIVSKRLAHNLMKEEKTNESNQVTSGCDCRYPQPWRQPRNASLNLIFCDDRELIEYVQRIVGMAVIGKVYIEALIIAYGEGRNGKSTFWNAIAWVLGSYAGNMSADTMPVNAEIW